MSADASAAGGDAAAEYRLWRSGLVAEVEWTAEGEEEFHGPHVAMRRPGCERVVWRRVREEQPVLGPAERLRVLAHTCECLATLYEFCSVGGSYFVRKTVRGPDGDEVWESSRVRERVAEERWFRILRGLAR